MQELKAQYEKFRKSFKGSMITSEFFESDFKRLHIYPKETICEVHKQIYDLLVLNCQGDPEFLKEVLGKLEVVYLMGMKLCKKLIDYKCALPEWKDNDDEYIQNLRRIRVRLSHTIKEVGALAKKKEKELEVSANL